MPSRLQVKVKLPTRVACRSMNRVQKQKHLAQANRHIADLAVQILRQNTRFTRASAQRWRNRCLMRSKGVFAHSRSTGYFYSVAEPPTTANKEKAPAARPGLGWDLTERTIMGRRSLHNSAIIDHFVMAITSLEAIMRHTIPHHTA